MTGSKRLLILGGGGHAAVVAEAATNSGWSLEGFLDDNTVNEDNKLNNASHLGGISDLRNVINSLAGDIRVHAAIGSAKLREKWLDLVGEMVAQPIIHPSAIVSKTATIKEGVFIGPGAVVNTGTLVERGVIINSSAVVEHDCVLNAFCHIAPGAVLGGSVKVGRGSLIGINAAVLPGITIGYEAIIGAGAVAVNNIADCVTAVGAPAQIVQLPCT